MTFTTSNKIITSIYLALKPMCWKDENGQINGPFAEALGVAARHLNLSLKFKDTLPKNAMKWFIK